MNLFFNFYLMSNSNKLLTFNDFHQKKEGATMKKVDLYQEVTDTILKIMDKEGLFWEQPWFNYAKSPVNITTNKEYRGINYFLLKVFSNDFNGCNTWGTFKAFKAKNYKINKGEKAHKIFFFKWIEVEDKETKEDKKIALLKHYNVFNLVQTDAPDELKFPKLKKLDTKPIEKIQRAEDLISLYEDKPTITHNEPRAFFRPSEDRVNMPPKNLFSDSVAYYSILFHELVHSTGSSHRLDRLDTGLLNGFGSHEYSKEELVAELGASYLNALCDINTKRSEEQSAVYLKGWLSALKNDKKLFMGAAQNAQKAVDYIIKKEF